MYHLAESIRKFNTEYRLNSIAASSDHLDWVGCYCTVATSEKVDSSSFSNIINELNTRYLDCCDNSIVIKSTLHFFFLKLHFSF